MPSTAPDELVTTGNSKPQGRGVEPDLEFGLPHPQTQAIAGDGGEGGARAASLVLGMKCQE